MSGYFCVTISATCFHATTSGSVPDHMNHVRCTCSALAAWLDRASSDATKQARRTPRVLLIGFLPVLLSVSVDAGRRGVRTPAGSFQERQECAERAWRGDALERLDSIA